MSILKHDVEFNHVMLHVVAWVKAKQLTSGYIPLKIIHLLISLSCRLLGISKDRDILAKSFVAFITFLPTWIMLSIYYVLLLTICKIKTFFSFFAAKLEWTQNNNFLGDMFDGHEQWLKNSAISLWRQLWKRQQK